jgi:transcriptional regulator with XRE-family HTH domain
VSQPKDKRPAYRLGQQLKRLRIAAGYATQPALATRVGYGEDSISKVESGERVPSEGLFPAWLDACAVHARDNTPVLTDGERQALTEFWETLRETGGVKEFFEKYATAEAKAAFLRMWGLLLIPGPLQTREYAEAVFRKGGMDEDEIAGQLDLRVSRQAKVDGPDAAHVTVLVYEFALHRMVGSPEIMIAQLERLLELSHRRNVVLQVVPDTGEYFPGLDGEFQIVTGPGISDTVIMVTVEDHASDESGVVGKVIALWEEVRSYALNAAQSRVLITEAIEKWQSQQQSTPAGASPAIATVTAEPA